jgi:hypothetical protein
MTKGEQFVEQGIELYERGIKEKQLQLMEKLAIKHNLQLVKA